MTVVDQRTGEVLDFDRAAAERRAERITLRLDAIADNYNAVMPMIREAIEKRDDLALGYRSPGEYVSDRFGRSLAGLGITVRRAVVGELTEAGLSSRAIAPIVDVSDRMVRKDQAAIAGGNRVPTSDDYPSDVATGGEVTPPADQPGAMGAGVEEPGEAVEAPPSPPARPAVTGLDGKTYTRPEPRRTVADDVAEFPDLAYYADTDPQRAALMAEDLRRYRDRGELDERLAILRRSIAGDQARREAPRSPATQTTRTCPTCNGRGVVKE